MHRSPARSGYVLDRLRKESSSWRRSSNWHGAREEDRRARKELEQKLARMEKGKASSKSSSSCVEAKEEDSHASDSATVVYRRVSGSGSSSVKARYYMS
jgi:hypothetical protein